MRTAARVALAALALAPITGAGGCAFLLGERTARRAGLTREATAEAPEPPAPDADLHPVILAYRESLRPFLGAREQEALDALDWSGTAGGDTERLRYLAADRAIRRVLPMLLEAEGQEPLDLHAARLRALPPLLNRDTDLVAQRVVVEAVAALDRARRGDIPTPPRAMPVAAPAPSPDGAPAPTEDAVAGALAALPSERGYDVDPMGEAMLAEALAEYAVEYSRTHHVSALHGAAAAAAASDTMDVAFLLGRALQTGAGRELVFQEALALGEALGSAARRRERLPRLHQDAPAVSTR